MPRNRSRSPHGKRERRSSRSRSRERRHRKKRSRSRSPRHRGGSPSRHRSRSPHSPRRRQRSSSPSKNSRDREVIDVDKESPERTTAPVDSSQLKDMNEEQVDMMKLMGFATFDTTKGKKVSGNDVSAVNIQRKRRYRQYMNRRGGFNRPLDFIA